LQVRPIRISHIIIDHDVNDLFVSFTLLDVPPVYGPVETPIQEHKLEVIIDRLKNLIDNNAFHIRAKFDTKEVVLRAKVGSLSAIYTNEKTIVKTTGPKITGLWIGFIILGLALGIIGSFFVIRKITQ